MRAMAMLLAAGLVSLGWAPFATAQQPKPTDYYRVVPLPIPEGIVLEVGGIQVLPDGRVAVGTRRGDIYLIENALADPPEPKYHLFARGLHEVLGLAYRDGWLYATQRGEVTRLKDTTGDGKADLVETFCDGWEINGDYHEYAFSSKFDKDGDLWITLCLTGSFSSQVKFRGWCVRVRPDGALVPTCSGIRSPGGMGMNAAGDVFYTDNQGPWNGTCTMKHLAPGKFQGHPDGNRWYDIATNLGPKPQTPASNSRMMVEAKRIPELEPPAIYFPYNKMGQSASGVACDLSKGKFGPFQEQLFVGDQTHSTVMRVYLEKVKGHYQGACFPFVAGISSGTLPLEFMPDGSLMAGGTNRGWGSRGNKPFSLDRIVWTGAVPFEIHEMHAEHNGFTLTFTQPVDAATAGDPASYEVQTYTYIYQSAYGSPEVDHTKPAITKLEVAPDRRSVRLTLDKVQEGHIHELHARGVRSAEGLPLLHPSAYYTLNYLPDGP